ncbi:hypothetical protein HYQ44_017139 [Verticillium longisporum]|nr:hypothetical protein HYQ44_017139 [Verticillium longisporum]
MATLGLDTTKKHKVTVVGSGNWGSTISKIVAENTKAFPDIFEEEVQMWVYEEDVTLSEDSPYYDSATGSSPQKLTHIINTHHENTKYLPGVRLPTNLIANPSVVDAARDATILIFNLPHQFIGKVCDQLRGNILPFARGISCIKGVNVSDDGVSLFSEWIGDGLGIYVGALSGANIASEIAAEKWSETTIAYDPPPMDNSRVPTPRATSRTASPGPASPTVAQQAANGANKIIAGLQAMTPVSLHHKDARGRASKTKLTPFPATYPPLDHETFKQLFHRPYFHAFFGQTVRPATFTEESAGVADLITSCSGGRNFRCARKAVLEGLTVQEVEERELNGQKLQGTSTAAEVNSFLKARGLEKEYPLFTAVHEILEGRNSVDDIPQLRGKRGQIKVKGTIGL